MTQSDARPAVRSVLTVDIGGTHVKLLREGASEPRRFDSGPNLTPDAMVRGVLEAAGDWTFDAVSIGCPAPVREGRLLNDPFHLGSGWVDFDYAGAFKRPVQLINDAAMQALGSYEGGRMLFLGLGTGLGAALVLESAWVPLELGRLTYRKGRTFEDYVGVAGLQRLGCKKWARHVERVVDTLRAAFLPDYVMLGGGNAKRLERLPQDTRLGANENAFRGGFRLWR